MTVGSDMHIYILTLFGTDQTKPNIDLFFDGNFSTVIMHVIFPYLVSVISLENISGNRIFLSRYGL